MAWRRGVILSRTDPLQDIVKTRAGRPEPGQQRAPCSVSRLNMVQSIAASTVIYAPLYHRRDR
jgi:hypothetical protein